jgi:hypothetical protein
MGCVAPALDGDRGPPPARAGTPKRVKVLEYGVRALEYGAAPTPRAPTRRPRPWRPRGRHRRRGPAPPGSAARRHAGPSPGRSFEHGSLRSLPRRLRPVPWRASSSHSSTTASRCAGPAASAAGCPSRPGRRSRLPRLSADCQAAHAGNLLRIVRSWVGAAARPRTPAPAPDSGILRVKGAPCGYTLAADRGCTPRLAAAPRLAPDTLTAKSEALTLAIHGPMGPCVRLRACSRNGTACQ